MPKAKPTPTRASTSKRGRSLSDTEDGGHGRQAQPRSRSCRAAGARDAGDSGQAQGTPPLRGSAATRGRKRIRAASSRPVQTCYDLSLAARPTTKRLRLNAWDCSHMLRQNADADATIKQHLLRQLQHTWLTTCYVEA